MRATNTPRLIQAIGLWLLVATLVLTPLSMWLIHRFVPPHWEIDGWMAYKTWPENVWAFSIGVAVGLASLVLILVGAALRLTRRPATVASA